MTDKKPDTGTSTGTEKVYEVLYDLHEYFNARVFVPKQTPLPRPVFTAAPLGRTRYGHFSAGRWFGIRSDGSLVQKEEGRTVEAPDEINIHSELGMARPFVRIAATVYHESCHQAQHHYPAVYGKPGKNNYHNKQWHEACQMCGLLTEGSKGTTEVTEAFRTFMRDFPDPDRWVARKAISKETAPTRLRKWVCKCETHVTNVESGQEREGPYIIRYAGSGLAAVCGYCVEGFAPVQE